MSDREQCKLCFNCKKHKQFYICDVATPYWVDSPPIILNDVEKMVTCNTFVPVLIIKEST